MNKSKTILVIVNDFSLRKAICEAFEMDGFNTLAAASEEQALKLIVSTKKPGLIFFDSEAPIVRAHNFIGALKQNPSLASVPVVVTSSYVEHNKITDKLSFLKKPFDLDFILMLVHEHCELAEA